MVENHTILQLSHSQVELLYKLHFLPILHVFQVVMLIEFVNWRKFA